MMPTFLNNSVLNESLYVSKSLLYLNDPSKCSELNNILPPPPPPLSLSLSLSLSQIPVNRSQWTSVTT